MKFLARGLLYDFQYGVTEAKKLEYNNDARIRRATQTDR